MILLVGAGGFLGRRMTQALKNVGQDALRASHGNDADLRIDLSQPISTLELPNSVSHGVILSSITSIDACFQDPERTTAFNVTHTIQLIEHLIAQDITPVFVSSDVVFDGMRGDYREEEMPAPNTQYGKHKRDVELFLEQNAPHHLIVRLGKLYTLAKDDTSPISGLVRSLSRGESVQAATDQYLTPTLAEEVADGILKLIALDAQGVFHLTPTENGALTRFEMALKVAKTLGVAPELVHPCSIHDFDFLEARPTNSTLNGEKFQAVSAMRLTPFCEAAKDLA